MDQAGHQDSGSLIREASRGDETAMETLLQRHLGKLHAFLRIKAGEQIRAHESISDLAQSVCREILQDVGDFSYQGEAQFRQWLFTAAMRKIIDRGRYYQAQKRNPDREASQVELESLFTPSRDAVAHEELDRIKTAFESLSEAHREVILMSRIYGYTNKEIAAQLGKGEDAIRMLLGRALTKLSGLLD